MAKAVGQHLPATSPQQYLNSRGSRLELSAEKELRNTIERTRNHAISAKGADTQRQLVQKLGYFARKYPELFDG